ncbi:hypothetical protein MTR_2g090175 [Medicago truncatula]|uniref:Uncharacterized protein n=1 Tax=Medicago truncatula TaxID=3880 RepID=A0A072VLQ5_MEDTR|nr:hypothetical protein MTR_2g090175 [Medicago truncatula]
MKVLLFSTPQTHKALMGSIKSLLVRKRKCSTSGIGNWWARPGSPRKHVKTVESCCTTRWRIKCLNINQEQDFQMKRQRSYA